MGRQSTRHLALAQKSTSARRRYPQVDWKTPRCSPAPFGEVPSGRIVQLGSERAASGDEDFAGVEQSREVLDAGNGHGSGGRELSSGRIVQLGTRL